MYVRAEHLDQEAYEAAKKHDPKVFKTKRKAWKRKEETGDKILRLTNEFGLGVVCCIPSTLTYSHFEKMQDGYLKLLMHGLKNGPNASDFRSRGQRISQSPFAFAFSRLTTTEFKKKVTKDLYLDMLPT